MRIVLIIKEDIKLFPPVLTIISALLSLGRKVSVVGHYSDSAQLESLRARGVDFHDTGLYDVYSSLPSKLKGNVLFRRRVRKILDSMNLEGEEYYLWIFQEKTISLLHKFVERHPVILHPLEFTGRKIKLFYRLLSPGYDPAKTYQAARKVVNCEYNRAQITKGLFNLERLPYILPNKMMVDEEALLNPPAEVLGIVEEVKARTQGKRVILYQGIFLKGERRLQEFCRAVSLLGKDYALVVMGSNQESGYRQLKAEFPDADIIFVPFVNPPYHLLVTRLAHVGILTYFPRPDSIATVINPLYCAPNKIFEYGRYGMPMIGNDIPGLHYIFKEFRCGETVGYPMTEQKIKHSIERIFENYDEYSAGALAYFNSVDVVSIVKEISE